MKLCKFLFHVQYSAGRPGFVSEARWTAMLLWLAARERYGEPLEWVVEDDA